MIVPRTRVIVLAVVILLPLSIAVAVAPQWVGRAWVIVALAVLAGAWDAWSSRNRLRDVSVAAPSIARMTVERPAELTLTFRKPAALSGMLRVGLALPKAIASGRHDARLRLSPDFDTVCLRWPCRAVRRGRYSLEQCYLETASAWGLWAVRHCVALACEIRAYPNLADGRHYLNGLFRRNEWGLRTRRKVGKGREFEQLREYLPGDSFEDIDWKATARRRFPITKVFQVEQAQEIYVILDASRLSTRSMDYTVDRRRRARSVGDPLSAPLFERYVAASLVMAVAAEQAADRYGLMIFSDTVDCFLKAGRGPAHYNACREALYNRMPRAVSPDFDEVFTYLGAHVRKRALLVFLTSLDDPALTDSFLKALPAVARQHVMLVNMLRPPGAHPLFSSEDVRAPAAIYQHLVGHMLWAFLADNRRRFKQHGVGFHLLEKETLCSQLVNQYMDVKQRQIL